MSLVADWKSAKTLFKSATDKKKPSQKFMGFIAKGTGIESSLKKADDAKNVGDLRTALAQFKKDGDGYIKILKGTIADPTSVPVGAKGDYLAAVGKLNDALNKLLTTGVGMASSLDGAGKKDKVDPQAVKKEYVLATHLALRKKMAPLLTKTREEYKGELAEINECIKQATTQTNNAKKERSVGNRSGALVAIDVVRRFREKAEGILAAVEKGWDKIAKDPEGMMAARMDSSIYPDTWTNDKIANYKKESGTAFRTYDDIQIEIRQLITNMDNGVKQVETITQEAETYSGQGVDASVYVKRLTDMNNALAGIIKWTADLHGKVTGRLDTQEKLVEAGKTPAPLLKQQFTNLLGAENKGQPEITQRQQIVQELNKRSNLIPAEDRRVPSVAPLFQTFTTQSAKATTDLANYRIKQQDFINFLTKELQKLG